MSSKSTESYQYLIAHIVPGPNSVSYFVPLILLPLALLIPPSTLSQRQLSCLFLPIIHACFLHSCFKGGGLDVISANAALWSTVLIGLQDCRGIYRRIHAKRRSEFEDDAITKTATLFPDYQGLQNGVASPAVSLKNPSTWEEPYPATLIRRIPWALNLIISIRFSNWKINDAYHDAHQPPRALTRPAYLRHALFIASSSYLLLDTAAFFAHHDSYFHNLTFSITSPLPKYIFLSNSLFSGFLACILRSTTLATHIYALLTFGGALSSLPLLLLPDAYSPHTYPLFFGPFSAVADRGIRGLWGQWWHQTVRYATSMPGRALSQALGLRAGGRGDYALRTITAFGFSGIIHAGLVPPEPKWVGEGVGAWKIRGCVGVFFWVQILGVGIELMVEDIVRATDWGKIAFGGKYGKVARRMGVLTWVACWVGMTVPILGWVGRQLGWFRVYPLPVSLWMGLREGSWWTWT